MCNWSIQRRGTLTPEVIFQVRAVTNLLVQLKLLIGHGTYCRILLNLGTSLIPRPHLVSHAGQALKKNGGASLHCETRPHPNLGPVRLSGSLLGSALRGLASIASCMTSTLTMDDVEET